VPLGELVDLSVSASAPRPKYLVSSSYDWLVLDITRADDGSYSHAARRVRSYADADGGQGVFFSPGISPRRMLVVCAATHFFAVVDEKDPTKLVKAATRTVILRAELVVGEPKADPVPVPPGPKPDPNPAPEPKPLAFSKLCLVVIEETSQSASNRGAFFSDPALAKLMADKGHAHRIDDQNVVGADGAPPADIARFLDAAKGKALPQYFLVDAKGKTRSSGDLPKTAAEMVALITKFQGVSQ
jgi:hypothetical protein